MNQASRQGRCVSPVTLLAGMLLAWCPNALALNPGLDISQYAHTAWRIRDGFSRGFITCFAQTADGYLWLGSESGLLRFDGVRNVPWQPPAGQSLPSTYIRSLLSASDGTLWIGTLTGLASWKSGTLTRYPELAGQSINAVLEDREGTIWIAGSSPSSGRLCAVQASDVRCHGEDGAFGQAVTALYEQKGGTLWVASINGLWRWKPGPPTRLPLSGTPTLGNLAEDDDGALLVGTSAGVRRIADATTEETYRLPAALGQPKYSRLLRDRDGGLWIGTVDRGLLHVHEGRTDVFSHVDGLSGDFVNRLFEDREGTVWVATLKGLDRFRELAVPTISVGQGLSDDTPSSVDVATDGSVWIGSRGGLDRLKEGRVETNRNIISPSLLHSDSGRMWVSTAAGVGYVEDGKFVRLPGVPGGPVRSMSESPGGDLWIASQEQGLIRVSPNHDVVRIPWARLGHQDPATVLVADGSRGGLWLGFLVGGIAYFREGQVRASYSRADGLADGRVFGLHVDSDGTLWAAAEGGVSRVKDGQVATLSSKSGLPCDAVYWLMEDDLHSVWLYMACGLVRIPRSALDAWGSNPASAIAPVVFDESDGVRLHGMSVSGAGPLVARSSDGRLWFLSGDGVSVLNPRRLPTNGRSPPVQIETITADRRTYDATSVAMAPIRLPPRVRDVQIDYTALSLVAPEKNRFRYKLEGRDRDWQDVGTRRQAFYNDLPPGTYRFRVMASNNSGVWNETGASLDFAVAAAYYQTPWFLALSAGLVIGVIWAAHRLRLRVVERHKGEISALNERLMKAQEQERIRIAGELHDGVMQEMLAVTMMLGTTKRRLPDGSEAKEKIDTIQEKLIRLGTEIRRLSHDLHPPILQDAGLPQALRGYCEQFSSLAGIPVSCDADEQARDLSRGAALALFRIAQEALGNAAKHAHAKAIAVRLARTDGMVSLTIADDGVGFDGSRLGAPGGLGLVMMRERATQLDGRFEVDSAPGRGTTIRVVIPFR